MLLAFGALAAGIIILIFSADKFVEGAAVVAKRLGLPSILIGMLVIGFGSSAPEMVISALSSYQGNPSPGAGKCLRFQHHQYRIDSWGDRAYQPHLG